MIFNELDIHTHSIASGHYTQDTITDMAKQAARLNLKLLGISEHGPAIPGSCTSSYFLGLAHAPATRMGVRLLYGAEVNIIDHSGTLDLECAIIEKLDYCIAGMHLPCLRPGTVSENTAAYTAAMKNPHVKVIAHPDDVKYPVNYRELLEAAMKYQVLLEINNSSLAPDGYRGDTKENNRAILELCREYHYPVLLSSDSHGYLNVGNFSYAMELIHEMNFPEELIINRSAEQFLQML